MTVTDYLAAVDTPKLKVPEEFRPTWKGRGWLIPPIGNNPIYTPIAALIPALLGTILIFMDQQITAVIVNRKEHKLMVRTVCKGFIYQNKIIKTEQKAYQYVPMQRVTKCLYDSQCPSIGLLSCPVFDALGTRLYSCSRSVFFLQKGGGYHLDLLIVTVLIVICSVFGLPWFVAATVLSINHVKSLTRESETAAPGEKPQFLGIREQRVTHVVIFITIGLSVLMGPLLKRIPMPVLYGVFLYMGVASLNGLQFFDRLLLFLMPKKYQPDLPYLRRVPLGRVHLFTIIQFACLVLLWIIKDIKATSILFPIMVGSNNFDLFLFSK